MLSKKLAFIVDVKNWAFDIIARHVQEMLSNEYTIKVYYWEDYPSAMRLINHLLADNVDHIHFFFRDQLKVILDTLNGKDKKLLAFNRLTITTHIPDYLYSSDVELFERKKLFDFVNGYFVINSELNNIYEKNGIFAKPMAVIYDWPLSEFIPRSVDGSGFDKQKINIMWAGNSKWGDHAGYNDYKGFETVIMPAIRQLQHDGFQVEFLAFDSAIKHYPRETVLAALGKSDVLLIASEAEGTPLTLIEAMAAGVAVVTTRVGIAPEVLPNQYSQYTLVDRSSDAFYESLKVLIQDKQKLSDIKLNNQTAFHDNFSSNGILKQKWLQFLKQAQSIKKSTIEREACYSEKKSYTYRLAIKSARSSVYFLKKTGLFGIVKTLIPKSAILYNQLLHGNNKKLFFRKNFHNTNYSIVLNLYKKQIENNKDKPLIIYAPIWKGVAASSESLFDSGHIRFPYFDDEYPEVESHPFLDKLVELLAQHKCSKVIYSGGSVIHMIMAEKLKERYPVVKQYFLWHGSPAQWVEQSQFEHFRKWHNLYNKKIIQGVISVKPDLDKTLNKLGIKSYGLINPIPNLSIFKNNSSYSNSKLNDQIHIGVFSAVSSWYKNPYVQLLATLCNDKWLLYTNIHQENLKALDFNIERVQTYDHMPRKQFLELLGSLDINLYVTNTECSPMTVLESCALSVPCIVGPAGDIYSSISKELASYLVEPAVDNPYAIYQRINLVLNNKEKIIEMLPDFIEKYNDSFFLIKNELYKKL